MEYILGRKKGTSGLGNYEIASIAADTVVALRGPDLLPGCSQRPEHSPCWSSALPTPATTNQELGCCAGGGRSHPEYKAYKTLQYKFPWELVQDDNSYHPYQAAGVNVISSTCIKLEKWKPALFWHSQEKIQSVARQYVCCFTGTKPLMPLGYVPAIEVCVQSSFLSSACRERLPALFGWSPSAAQPLQSMGKISPL